MIAKEFKYHDFCYKEFTRRENLPKPSNPSQDTRGNIDAVVSCIKDRIISQNEAISMGAYMKYTVFLPKTPAIEAS